MNNGQQATQETTNLSYLTEQKLRCGQSEDTDVYFCKLLHKPQVQQVEIELQNKELNELQGNNDFNLNGYTEFFDFSPTALLSLRKDGAIDLVNLAGVKLLGDERTKLIGRNLRDFISFESMHSFDMHMKNVFSNNVRTACDLALIAGDKRQIYVHIETIADNSKPICRMSLVDITHYRRVENTLRFVVQQGWTGGVDNIFAALAQYLGELLEVDYVFIARLTETPGVAETVTFFDRGTIKPNIRFELNGTPCADVLDKNLCYYQKDIQTLFPNAALLKDMHAEGYAGVSLWDSTGQSIGLIAVIGSNPFPDRPLVTLPLKLAATRAAAELEHFRSDRVLLAQEKQFRTLAEQTPSIIVRYDQECRCIYVNLAYERETGITLDQAKNVTPDMQWGGNLPILEYEAKLKQAMNTGVLERLRVEWLKQDSGKVVYYEIYIVPECSLEGSVLGAVVIGHNVSTLVETERRLQESHAQLYELTVRREDAREEERKRIARDLHDELGQQLTALRLDVSLMRINFGQDNPLLIENVREIIERVDNTIQVVRNVASKLRPAILDLGLAYALEWQAKEFAQKSGLHCELNVCKEQILLDEERIITIFRIVQESLTNIARHAQAKKVNISLRQVDGCYLLEVRDDGRGYNPEVKSKKTFGLIGIQERVLMLKGELSVISAPSLGTTVKVSIPVQVIASEP